MNDDDGKVARLARAMRPAFDEPWDATVDLAALMAACNVPPGSVLVRVERKQAKPGLTGKHWPVVHDSILLRDWMATITTNRLDEVAARMERDLRLHPGIEVRSPADEGDVYIVRLKGKVCPDCGHEA